MKKLTKANAVKLHKELNTKIDALIKKYNAAVKKYDTAMLQSKYSAFQEDQVLEFFKQSKKEIEKLQKERFQIALKNGLL
jgi:hypothetical protein